jgi:cell division GTPase FtsZ
MMNTIAYNSSIIDTAQSRPHIKVLGLGGAGCNTIARLSALHIPGVELIAANTDKTVSERQSGLTKDTVGSQPDPRPGIGR